MSDVDVTETPPVATDAKINPKVEEPSAPHEMTAKQSKERLKDHIALKKLEKFYPDVSNELATRAANMANELRKKGCTPEMANQFAILSLYDLAILLDDSDSMKYEEEGARIKTLQKTLNNISEVYGLAREKGILTVRFLNAPQGKKNVTTKTVRSVLKNHNYGGVTRIGTELKKKILDKFVNNNMEKPLLIMTITDGAPEGEMTGLLETVIVNCIAALGKDGAKGPHSVAFQFSRVGSDLGAEKLMQDLDDHPKVGEYVDSLPMTNRLEDVKDPEKKWILLSKLLLGAISSYWDTTDEIENKQDQIEGGSTNNVSDVEDPEDPEDNTPSSDTDSE